MVNKNKFNYEDTMSEQKKGEEKERKRGQNEALVIPLKWHAIEDGLPPDGSKCAIYGRWQERYGKGKRQGEIKYDNTIQDIATFHGGLWHRYDLLINWHSHSSEKITHFIVLPEVPFLSV